MDSDLKDFYEHLNKIANGSTIDLSDIESFNPWSLVIVCLLLIKKTNDPNKKLILPRQEETKSYLKMFGFDNFLRELGYINEAEILSRINLLTENKNIQKLMHCLYRDNFNAQLGHFLLLLQSFGLNQDDAARVTALIGELGNNVFDHNLGNWPTDVVGCLVAMQNYPDLHKVEIVIGDPGAGFYGSLKTAFPEISNDIEAIKKGLSGSTGRVGEERGNGLRLIQEWTIGNFSGKVTIHSGNGLVIVDKEGIKEYEINEIIGTLAQSVINYR